MCDSFLIFFIKNISSNSGLDQRICQLCHGVGDQFAPHGVPCGRLLPLCIAPQVFLQSNRILLFQLFLCVFPFVTSLPFLLSEKK
jgi:hypothetical protein